MNRHTGCRLRTRCALVVGCLLLAGAGAHAQDSSSPPSSGNPEKPVDAPMKQNTSSYAVSLGTGELINMNGEQSAGNASSGEPPLSLTEYEDGLRVRPRSREFKNQFSYGLSVASAYASTDSGTGTSRQELATIVPYFAVMVPTKTGSYVLQYSAVINPDDTSVQGGGLKAYHSASLTAQGALSRRWYWTLTGNGSYGSESARAEGPLTFLVIQNTPVADASATVRLPATNILFLDNTARLTFQRSSRDTISFALSDTYTEIRSDSATPVSGLSSNTLGVKADYARTVSSRLSLIAYGDIGTMFTSPACYAYGGGVGLSAKLSYRVRLEVQGGPQHTSAGCGPGLSGNFNATITANLNARDRVYASASRVFATAYQVNGTGEDSYVAGFFKNLGRFNFATDAGYIRETLMAAPPYNGYFVAPRLQFKITGSLGFTAGYRVLHGAGGNVVRSNLNYAVVSLDWHPASLHFK
jgi:hypothetical protein